MPRSMLAASLAAADEAGCVFSIDAKTGDITPISLDEYASLHPLDPRLDHVRMTRAQAERASLILRGIETQRPDRD